MARSQQAFINADSHFNTGGNTLDYSNRRICTFVDTKQFTLCIFIADFRNAVKIGRRRLFVYTDRTGFTVLQKNKKLRLAAAYFSDTGFYGK